MVAAVTFSQIRKIFIKNVFMNQILQMRYEKTARNSLTQVNSTHTNVEDSSKYIRQNMFSPYNPCAPPTTDYLF
jgi:hypothetical protein